MELDSQARRRLGGVATAWPTLADAMAAASRPRHDQGHDVTDSDPHAADARSAAHDPGVKGDAVERHCLPFSWYRASFSESSTSSPAGRCLQGAHDGLILEQPVEDRGGADLIAGRISGQSWMPPLAKLDSVLAFD